MEELTQKYVKELFDYKNGILYWKNINSYCHNTKNGDKAGTISHGYYNIRINNKIYKSHRLIYLYHNGYLPKYIDHIDRNPSNNNIENLRKVTKTQNMMNSKSQKNSSSIYKGVTWDKETNKWMSQIIVNKKRTYLGRFINEQNAAKAYNKAAIKYFKEYANLNEVE